MNYQELLDKIKAYEQRIRELGAIVREQGRPLTTEETTELDAIEAELPGLKRARDLAEQTREEDRRAVDARVVHDRADDSPNPFGPDIPAAASDRERRQLLEVGFGNYLAAVAQASSPGGNVDSRLRAAASGQNTNTPSDGGFMVRRQYSDMLIDAAMTEAILAPLCNSIPIGEGFDGLEAPMIEETSRATGSRFGGVQVYRRDEADSVTATKVKLNGFDVRLEDLMGLAYSTDRALRDATSLGAVMAGAFISEMAWTFDDEIWNGNGSGRAIGMVNAANPSIVSVGVESGQTTTDPILWENLTKMWARIPARLRARAYWFYNQELEPYLDALVMPAGLGAFEPRFVTYGPDGLLRIKNRPAIAIEQAAAPNTTGDIGVVVPGEYVVISKGGIQSDESMHVRFVYNERTFRWLWRVNGAPTWKSSKSPANGSNPLSPFVKLDTRS